jgi:hypothetical protein
LSPAREKLISIPIRFCSRLDCLNSLCSASKPGNSSPSTVTDQHVCQSVKVDTIDRKSYLIIFGVAEDRDISVWHGEVDDILSFVVNRHVDVMDTFRLCGRH